MLFDLLHKTLFTRICERKRRIELKKAETLFAECSGVIE
jgi:hypothetical protein